jgi:hypothetical protein
MEGFSIFILGLIAGGLGYLLVTFWFSPIIRYRNVKHEILSDLIFFANVINAGGLSARLKDRLDRRIEANRRHSAELTACFFELPLWYKKWMERKNENPQEASQELMGLSNTYDFNSADNRIVRIKKSLRFETKIV